MWILNTYLISISNYIYFELGSFVLHSEDCFRIGCMVHATEFTLQMKYSKDIYTRIAVSLDIFIELKCTKPKTDHLTHSI